MSSDESHGNGNTASIDINTKLGEASDVADVSASARLKFAKQVLLGLAMISTMVFVCYGLEPDDKAWTAIFEFIKIGALPLVTLVVSFYFPNKTHR